MKKYAIISALSAFLRAPLGLSAFLSAPLRPSASLCVTSRLSALLFPLLLLACAERPITTAAPPLPTVAATALLSFDPSATPITPTPAPTLPSPTPGPTTDDRPQTTAEAEPPPEGTPTAEAQPSSVVGGPSSPEATPDPAHQINGVPFETLAVLPPAVVDNVRAIFARGQALGRNPRAFSKLGDSAVLTESNLTRFDNGPLTLGPYEFLRPTIDHYAGSWGRYGVGARVALTTHAVFDPMWASAEWCSAGEHLLACEFRLHNPAVLLIRLGTNDGRAEAYERNLREIVAYSLEQGVVPVLGTKADRFEGDDSINAATRRVAAELAVPLWEFDRLADTLPGRGLREDNAHLTVYGRNDYTDPQTFAHGYPMSDLSALVVLDAVRRVGEIGE